MIMDKKQEYIKKFFPMLIMAGECVCYFFLKKDIRVIVLLLLEEILICFGFIAAWSDVVRKIIPNQLILLMLGVWFLVMIPQMIVSWSKAKALLIQGVAGFGIAGAMMLFVYWFSKQGLGGGDVKFIAVSGCYLGLTRVLVAVLFGSIFAAGFGIIMIVTKKMKKTDSFPFVPYLYAGMLLVLFLS